MTDDKIYDVVILSSGFSSSLMAAILANNGVDVLVLEAKSHPLFAIGESTIPRTSMMLKIMAERYNLPEIANLTHTTGNEPTSNGMKRTIGFVYHDEGMPQDPKKQYQTIIPEGKAGPEAHLYRQDSDAKLLHLAIEKGATILQNTPWKDVDISEDLVSINAVNGTVYKARYLVDGGGHSSTVVKQNDLRPKEDLLQTRSRSIFTHMMNVPPYEDIQEDGYPEMPRKWSQGTLHHIFDGGWMWVIPFDNHEASTNKLCSVGLTLDMNKYPEKMDDAEEEFWSFAKKFPSVFKHFKNAKAVRPWVSTGRLQYTSKSTTGHRYSLLSHGAGFVDPLYSRGLANTSMLVNALSHRLISAAKDGDYSEARFAPIDELQEELIRGNDLIVSASFASWFSPTLWYAWVRVWAFGTFIDWMRLNNIHKKYCANDESALERLENVKHAHALCPEVDAYSELLESASQLVFKARDGELDADDATAQIFTLLKECKAVPEMLQLSVEERLYDPLLGLKEIAALNKWIMKSSPDDMKQALAS